MVELVAMVVEVEVDEILEDAGFRRLLVIWGISMGCIFRTEEQENKRKCTVMIIIFKKKNADYA